MFLNLARKENPKLEEAVKRAATLANPGYRDH